MVQGTLTEEDRFKIDEHVMQTIAMLHSFKIKGHIDPDLFDLFLTSGLHRRYAERFLKPEQIDEVDIEKYVGPVRS